MMISVLFLILFLTCLGGIVYYPKSAESVSGIKCLIVAIAALVCMETGVGILFYRMHIPVGQVSMGIVFGICSAALWYGIWREKKVQRLSWKRGEILSVFLLVVFVCLIAAKRFGVELHLQYSNPWAAENFARAMSVARGQTTENVGFATIIEAMFVQTFTPFIAQEMSYKTYMFAVLFLLLVEILLFYVVVISLSEEKMVYVLAPVFALAYFWGYPVYNYMEGNDDSFSICSIWILLMIYGLCLLRQRREASNKIRLLYRIVLVAFGLCAIAMVFMRSWSDAAVEREIYASMYGDLVFFVPVAIYVGYNVFVNKKKSAEVCVLSMVMLGCTLVLYRFWYDGVILNFSYYQNYAILWLFGWLLAVQALDFSIENSELPQFFSYAGFIVTLAILVLSGFANKVAAGGGDRFYVTKFFFSLYSNNQEYLLSDYSDDRIEDTVLEFYGNVIKDYGEEKIPILTRDVNEKLWYDALTDNKSQEYSMTENELPELLEKLDSDGIQMVVVQKDKEEYLSYSEYFDGCEVIAENEAATLYKMPEKGWMDVSGMQVENYENKLELYSCINDNLSREQIPLMAARESYLDYILYESVTGNDSSEFYTWEYNARDGVVNLNEHDVKYIVLLQGDEYYIGSSMYYDAQEIVFENDAGKIVRCTGENWSLGE